MTLQETAQKALEAWDRSRQWPFPTRPDREFDALRAALAQPDQDPVLHKWAALFEAPNNDWQAGYESARRWVLEVGLQSIAAPPQRKPLTEEQMREVLKDFFFTPNLVFGDVVRAIEKAHGIGGKG
jgi:hypothetical protein